MIMSNSPEEKFDHPAQKPVALFERSIVNHVVPGGLVYDPFLGSGTTLIAAERTGRICHGLELDPLYVDTTIRRWQKLTGNKAWHAGDNRAFDDVAAAHEELAA